VAISKASISLLIIAPPKRCRGITLLRTKVPQFRLRCGDQPGIRCRVFAFAAMEDRKAGLSVVKDPRRAWQVRYHGGVLSGELETREDAINIACAQLEKGLNVEAVLGPNYQLIDRSRLEEECRRRRP
jgi:hypothetical protein